MKPGGSFHAHKGQGLLESPWNAASNLRFPEAMELVNCLLWRDSIKKINIAGA